METPDLSFRKATHKDQTAIVEFQISMAWETEKFKLDSDTCQRGVRAVFENPDRGQYYVAEKAGGVVGSLLIIPEWSDWRNKFAWWIHSVYVIPEERGGGVFSRFYRFVQERAEEARNVFGLRLYVDKTNTKAQEVYRKLGMTNQHYELYEWIREQ